LIGLVRRGGIDPAAMGDEAGDAASKALMNIDLRSMRKRDLRFGTRVYFIENTGGSLTCV
jgi:hypothetical protein